MKYPNYTISDQILSAIMKSWAFWHQNAGKNNYRLYTLDDLWRLNIIRDLRRLGFPMEKVREYMDNRSVENTRKLLTEELDAIHQQILN